jgi:hypothetical protein
MLFPPQDSRPGQQSVKLFNPRIKARILAGVDQQHHIKTGFK